MFSDITEFTAISETIPIEKLMESLSAYFNTLSKVIIDAHGTIDKFIGDSVMAFWGAPQPVVDPVKWACLAALQAQRFCNIEAEERGLPLWKTRFGLHLGEVIVGNIGTSERMNYTVIGDVVNTASRLTGLNKQYQTSIIISQEMQKQIDGEFITRPLDFVAVKGKKNKLNIYELVGTSKGPLAATDRQLQLCGAFTQAYEKLQKGSTEEARTQFLHLSQLYPEDVPIKMMLERI
jgi:adenylate cyclase